MSSQADAACAAPASDDRKTHVCQRWACDRATMAPATWNGAEDSCVPGRMDADGEARALATLNVYRFLANVPELVAEPVWRGPAQSCALLASANKKLSHEPSSDWACYSDVGAKASAVSLIANRSAPLAIDPFVEDNGNADSMVHRRWLLSDKIERIAFGSTDHFACAVVDGRQFDGPEQEKEKSERQKKNQTSDGASVTAWPPAGPVPFEALTKTSVDTTGWTIQSSTLGLDGGVVSVTRDDGEVLPVTMAALAPTLGSASAIGFVPDGWTTEADRTYAVHFENGAASLDYVVETTSCAQ